MKQRFISVLRHSGLWPLARRVRWWSKMLLFLAQGKRGAVNMIANQFAFESRRIRIPMPPVHITIEPTNVCDQACPVCETGARILERPRGRMSLEDFKTIIDRVVPHTNILFYYFMGEPFLNKDWYPMLRYAKDKGIPFISTCTNGHVVEAEKLVLSGIDEVSFQIGGITQETHEAYRVNGQLARVLKNCRETVEAKRRLGSNTPKVMLGFIVMKHNEHEVPEFRRVAGDIGVDEAVVVDPAVRTVDQGRLYLTEDEKYWFYNKVAFERDGVLRPKEVPNNECPWIYHSLVVTWNGDVVPCCRDPQGKFVMGNLLKQELGEIWNSPLYVRFREAIHAKQDSISICELCSSYSPPNLY